MVGYAAVMVLTVTIGLAIYLKSNEVARQNESFARVTLPTISAVEGSSHELSQIHLTAFALYGMTIAINEFDDRIHTAEASINNHIQKIATLDSSLAISDIEIGIEVVLNELTVFRDIMTSATIDWDAAREQLGKLQSVLEDIEKICAFKKYGRKSGKPRFQENPHPD